ncbi:MAG: hypothetical protein H6R06_1197 [Proteobacteria bacterium]|jgi:hypothetical protein|nr:hypothetical protein [Pseudomonadota bacterium]
MITSPCINVCRMDAATGWCEGCQRTLQEIATWSGLAEADKRAVWQALPERREHWFRLHPELRIAAVRAVGSGQPKGDPA